MRLSNVLRTNQSSFSIYIHWPYCQSKCTYCNFNKYVNPKDPPYDRLAKAMATELNWYLNQPKYQLQHQRLHSVYFGGGTPTLLGLAKPSVMAMILETIERFVHIDHDTEITAEFNPTSVEMTKLRAFRDVGINRLSLGIQSFDSKDLKILGRDHSGKEALNALLMAKDVFTKERVSFDLIYARPGQTLEAWRKELKQALDIAGDHLSMYQLSLEKSTPLHKQTLRRLVPAIPDSDRAADMYEETVNMAQAHGFAHYEVSSYARTQKAISRHNFAYWQGMDFLGVGPGAHGRLTDNQQRIRTFGEFHPEKYMALCEAEGEGIRKCQPISSQDMMEELIVFGMRTRMGIPRSRFMSMTNGKRLDDFLDQEALALFVKAGFLIDESSLTKNMECYIPKELLHEWSQGGIRPTESGLARIDSILPRLIKFI